MESPDFLVDGPPPLEKEASFLTKTMFENEKANPSTASIICGIHELKTIPKIDDLKELIKQKMLSYDDRFSSILTKENGKIIWKKTNVDFNRHIIKKKLPSPGNKEVLENFLSELHSSAMDPQYPLWYIYILTNWHHDPKQCLLLSCFHHELGDGVSLAIFWDKLYEACDEMNAQPFSRTGSHRSSIENIFQFLEFILIFLLGFLKALFALFYPKDTPTSIKLTDHNKLASKKKVAISNTFPLQMFFDIKTLVRGTVNDVFIAVISGGIRRYLLKHDPHFKKTKSARLHGVFPLTIRNKDDVKLGNRFTFCPLRFPVSEKDSLQRLYKCKHTSENLKRSPEAGLFILAQKLASKILPSNILLMMQGIMLDKFTLVFTNVPGPGITRSFAGSPISNLYGTVNSPIASCISLTTYDGKATMTIVSDSNVIPFPEKLILEMENELKHLHIIYKNQH